MRLGRRREFRWAEYPRKDVTRDVANPFRGFYSIFRFAIESAIAFDQNTAVEDCVLPENQTLCLVEINLMKYADEPLPDSALANAERILSFFRRSGRMMILRFLYDWDGRNIQTEPRQLQEILMHMEQLAPLLKAYAPWIFVIQGLFIGNWGEMHNSRFISSTSVCSLADKLFLCTGDETYMAVRSPSIWRVIARSYEPLEAGEAYSSRQTARIGLFNDGMLASPTDYGTYGSMGRGEAAVHGDKWVREDELDFQKQLCQYVPNGGEVVNPSEQNDLYQAVFDMRAMRVSYLNSGYDARVLDKWKAAPVRRAWGAWRGINGYDYISMHLGYRYNVEGISLQLTSGDEKKLRMALTVRNEGFAPCYRSLTVAMTARNAAGGARYIAPVKTNTRAWYPERTVTLTAEFDTSEWKGQRLLLCINLHDEKSGQFVQIANAFSYIASDGDNLLGAFELKDDEK